MANVKMKTENKYTVTFELDEEEKSILSQMVQNPLVSNESAKERNLRKVIFEGLNPPEQAI